MYIRGYADCYNNISGKQAVLRDKLALEPNGPSNSLTIMIENGLAAFNISWENEPWQDSQYGNHNITEIHIYSTNH